ncbi:MAG TPA: CysB family HTH-type transcriptional regulator [Limnobacter sp.]|uniref:CysB family HTH-type transcriptional regulator n=1 Tax=Limnobacter sp. TaxID=2003368 RepID=UPI002E354EE4|nr:CysB family HTH-type transcriptional regulator [Limnobacter sp.]HEX5485468.1 CysB family HTH-type transcriptional regulator [Limnobacter sp.]
MNFQQLRIIRETVRCGFNLTDVATALFTSQPGVSKHIRDLEDELGLEIFVRKGKRLTGLTDPGKELLVLVEKMLADARNIKSLADQFSNRDVGQLTVVTTHTQARYSLPQVVNQFRKKYPKVHLRLHQGSPREIIQMLKEGTADIGIATELLSEESELVSFPYYEWQHVVIAHKDHPLADRTKLSIAELVEYPLITYQEGFTGRMKIDQLFKKYGLLPDVAISALDADVIKTYVELELGVGVIASMAFDAQKDFDLRTLEISEDLPLNVTSIAVRRGHYLRSFAHEFIALCNPELSERHVKERLQNDDTQNLDQV